MEFREVYCLNCKKVLGRYNTKFYDEGKVDDIISTTHSRHVKNGHQVNIKNYEKD